MTSVSSMQQPSSRKNDLFSFSSSVFLFTATRRRKVLYLPELFPFTFYRSSLYSRSYEYLPL